MTNNDELREKAEAATPGPWFNDGFQIRNQYEKRGDYKNLFVLDIHGENTVPVEQKEANIAYVTAANPAQVIALLDEIRDLKEADKIKHQAYTARDWENAALRDELAQLRAELERARKDVIRIDEALTIPGDAAARTHSDDIAVDHFSAAMRAKLAKKRREGRGGWDDESQCEMSSLAEMLVDNVPKGDPVDIANFCMMLHQREQMAIEHHPCRGGSASVAIQNAAEQGKREPAAFLLVAAMEYWKDGHKKHPGAVQWATWESGELLIFTRGEYREQLMRNIATSISEPAPIDMILHCPSCGKQHIDAPEPFFDQSSCDQRCECEPGQCKANNERWMNPPHRSHLCHGCGNIWRPADVPTNGVEHINTAGTNDNRQFSRNAVAAPQAQQVDEQAKFERWAREDILWELEAKTKSGAAYKHIPTNCAFTGWCARAMLKGEG